MKLYILLAFLIICVFVNAQIKRQIINTENITGTWTLIKDKNSQITFTQKEEFDYYSNRLMTRFNYQINRDTLIAINEKDGEVYSYLIDGLTNKILTLKFIKSGYILQYQKK